MKNLSLRDIHERLIRFIINTPKPTTDEIRPYHVKSQMVLHKAEEAKRLIYEVLNKIENQ